MDNHSVRKPIFAKATIHLKKNDDILAKIIDKIGICTLNPKSQSPFKVLVSNIISQQLSAKAAKTIKNWLSQIANNGESINPKRILSLPEKKMRGVGISANKVGFIKKLAKSIYSEKLQLEKLKHEKNQKVIDILIRHPGIGQWTAEMFLIFSLGRLDVLSISDVGLRRAAKMAYGLNSNPSDSEFLDLGKPWIPYRTIASWYLWRTLDK